MRPWIVCINETEEDPAFWVYVYKEMTELELSRAPVPVYRLLRDLVSVPCTPDEARAAVQWCAVHIPGWKKNIKARLLIEGEECPHCDKGVGGVVTRWVCLDCSGTGINQRDVVENSYRGVKRASGGRRLMIKKAAEAGASADVP